MCGTICFLQIMQMRPPLPSLIIRFCRVSLQFDRASSGIRISLPCGSSLTSSWKDLPKILDCQNLFGISLKLLEQVVDHFLALLLVAHNGRDDRLNVRPDHVDGGALALAERRSVSCFIISGSSSFSSSMVGTTMP